MFQLTLVEYNNFEAGEGKSKLDTHFAHISHKIVRWVRVGNNLETGSQLGELIGVCIFVGFKVAECTLNCISKSARENCVQPPYTLRSKALYKQLL